MPWKPLPTADGPGREPVTLQVSLDRLARSLGAPASATLAKVFGQWSSLVGPLVADHVRPRSLTGGTLVVTVDEPGWATQLRFLEADLLRRLEGVVPGEVQRIEVRVGRPGG